MMVMHSAARPSRLSYAEHLRVKDIYFTPRAEVPRLSEASKHAPRVRAL